MKFTKGKEVYENDICEFDAKANSIIFPESIAEIEGIVKTSKHDIVPRGTGISFVGGCAPNDSIIIDMSKMNRVINIDPIRKIAYVEAGMIISDLNQELEKYGLEFPINPCFSNIKTIGGAIALNVSGDRELKYGNMRNWIDSLEVIDGKGELIEVSKTDASDFAGMEGTTGIIVRAKMRLTQKKKRTLSILKSDSAADLIAASRKLKLDHEITTLDMFDKKLSLMMGLENKYHLFVEYENNNGRMKDDDYNHFIKLKDRAYYIMASHGFTLLENPKFFMDHLKDFTAFLEQKAIPYYCNLGSSTVFTCFNPDDEEIYNKALELIKRLRAKIAYNLGIGLTKKDFLDRNEKNIIKRVKTRLDPDWKFNMDKMIDYALKDKKPEKIKEPINPKKIEELEEPEQDKGKLKPQETVGVLGKGESRPKQMSDEEKKEVEQIVKDIMEGTSKK